MWGELPRLSSNLSAENASNRNAFRKCAGTAPTFPGASAVGNCVDAYLLSSIVQRERDHGSSPGRNSPKAGCHVVVNNPVVRHPRESRDRLLNLCKFSIRDLTSRALNDPLGDRFQIPWDLWMEANSIHQLPRDASTAAWADENAVSRSTYFERAVRIRKRISSARAESATSRSSSSCIMRSMALATAAL